MHGVGRMDKRLKDLSAMPVSNLAPVVADRVQSEAAALRLFCLQQKVRRGLVLSHSEYAFPPPHQLVAWRKARPLSGTDREAYEREWLKRKEEMERSEKAVKHRAFIEEVTASHKAFTTHHQMVRALRDKICKQVKMWHKNAERMRDKERQDRLTALKSNDFDKYREYVKNAKVGHDRKAPNAMLQCTPAFICMEFLLPAETRKQFPSLCILPLHVNFSAFAVTLLMSAAQAHEYSFVCRL
jgi:hypothetical protein